MKQYQYTNNYYQEKYMSKIMGPNPLMLCEELMTNCPTPKASRVCDLGSGQGLTSLMLAKDFGFCVYACDLWSDPEENRKFFRSEGITDEQIVSVKADATDLPFEKEFFDAIVCVDSYNYFGRDKTYLDEKLLPYVTRGGYLYLAIPGMTTDLHDDLPPELLLSWTAEQLDYMQDIKYWTDIFQAAKGAKILEISTMDCTEKAWQDWLSQENEYAVSDRKSMQAGAGKYLNTLKIVLQKI